jgi:hypothetical protein
MVDEYGIINKLFANNKYINNIGEISKLYLNLDNKNDKIIINIIIKYETINKNKSEFEFRSEIDKKIYNRSIKLTNMDDIKKIHTKICILVLIYKILGMDSGHFWGIHPKFYEIINDKYENIIECFASPFNSNLKDYYSPIKSTDKYFGSKGNFFKNFLKDKYDVYIINPPFTEIILNKMLKMTFEKLKKDDNIILYIYLPYWKDIIDPYIKQII